MAETTYMSEQICDLFTPAGKYISLHTANPGFTGANELTTGNDANYVRKPVTLVKSLDGPTYRVRNSADVAMATAAAGASYTISHLCVWSAVTGGDCLAVLPLLTGIPVTTGGIVTFATNSIEVRGE